MQRRTFLKQSLVGGLSLASGPMFFPRAEFPLVRITDGQHFHWFGYYDKWQIDPTGRYALGARVPFEGRTPEATDKLSIGLIDLKNQNRWTELGTSRAWGWQQGCMLQWIPGSREEVIWNDREGGAYVSRIVNIRTKKQRTLPKAIYALSPNGQFAVGTEFNRIQNLRPGYGYAGLPDPYQAEKAPEAIGLYKMDLKTGKHNLLISIAEMARTPHQGKDVRDNWHWFNHLLVSPDSQRVLFLHRWRPELTDRQRMAATGFVTRMVTAGTDGQDRYIADPSGFSSHFVWRDPGHIFVWTKPMGQENGFWLLKDKTQESEKIGAEAMLVNGHNTYVPHTNHEWVLNDTYPQTEQRLQTLYLYHIPSKRKVVLGAFHAPADYKGEWRCDLHPRCDQQGKRVFFDSTHEGLGRQMYCIDIERIVRG
ncbi:hypothetical protein GCM10027275_46760 [Rhabdobacter roseus]|uniref:Uncharacterized protein n=1 Tax=Rhabdobacter roseus TaxID=1655419 RepID=A0A840U257_9BACT|nr:hypothetical protein [Rhabdobacter roseus]MBB5286448.1 hypothetical protein [Rhabdobacter roseus]